ncbi:hypothetical protein BC830DRAFT_775693 [Chytriomyces sp. MP71]|nr:hypothetical protein BC830DRAFT_775693 [Chytriomyces sp. MP71]
MFDAVDARSNMSPIGTSVPSLPPPNQPSLDHVYGESVDYWKFVNPLGRFLDLNLTEAGGQAEHAIKARGLAEAKEKDAKAAAVHAAVLAAQSATQVVATPPAFHSVPDAKPGDSKQPVMKVGFKRSLSSVLPPTTHSLLTAPIVSPVRSNSGPDLDLGMLGASASHFGTDVNDLQLDSIDDFDDLWGGGSSSTVNTTQAPTTSVTVQTSIVAASPAVSVPACSPAAFTPGITAVLSPDVPTPGVVATPHPTTPGFTGTGGNASGDESGVTNAPTPVAVKLDVYESDAPFNVDQILLPSPVTDIADDIVPKEWSNIPLDFGVVWGERGTLYGGKFVYHAAYSGRKRIARKRAAGDAEGSNKHVKLDVSESSDSESTSSGEDEEEEVIEDGEVLNGPGATTPMSGVVLTAIEPILPQNDVEADLALQLLVEGMTIGRGALLWMNEGNLTNGGRAYSLRPVFANKILQFLGTALADLFGNNNVDAATIRGPLTIEQMLDYNGS